METISYCGPSGQLNTRMKLLPQPVTALAGCYGRPGTGPERARAAPGHAAAYSLLIIPGVALLFTRSIGIRQTLADFAALGFYTGLSNCS